MVVGKDDETGFDYPPTHAQEKHDTKGIGLVIEGSK